jgi:hypothetical protein
MVMVPALTALKVTPEAEPLALLAGDVPARSDHEVAECVHRGGLVGGLAQDLGRHISINNTIDVFLHY